MQDISVAIISHNYGKYLGTAIQSVLGQSRLPNEVIVIDDSSSDNTREIAEKFKNRGVRYYRVDFQSPLLSRRFALNNTYSEYLICLDADDYLESDYIENGLKEFDLDDTIGIVYSDVQFFGDKNERSSYPDNSEQYDIARQNYIHAGAIVRRDALEVSRALYNTGPYNRHEDWCAWKKVLSIGYKAKKQKSHYYYRKHEQGISSNRHVGENSYSYYTSAALSEEEITIFTPLAGRYNIWKEYTRFLENQTWDHKKIHLVMMDTSRDAVFSEMVKNWLINCDYASIQYIPFDTSSKGLADVKRTDDEGYARHDVLKEVRLSMSRIYNRARKHISTDYLWIIEDDVIPPLDVCSKLLESFCNNTLSVSAPFPHRYEKGYVAWGKDSVLLKGGRGVEEIGGNGFGCVILRSSVFKNHVFTASLEHPDFDKGFYAKYRNEYLVKIDWGLECHHLSESYQNEIKKPLKENTLILEHEFDESFYLKSNPDVKKALHLGKISSPYEHYYKFGFKERRPSRKLDDLKTNNSDISDAELVITKKSLNQKSEITNKFKSFQENQILNPLDLLEKLS